MPQRLQGDIFEEWGKGLADFLLIFGHHGFNQLSASLAKSGLAGLQLPNGDGESGEPQKLADGRWCLPIFDSEASGARGISDKELERVFEQTYAFCRQHACSQVLTNGIFGLGQVGRTFHLAHNERAGRLYQIASENPDIETTFISMTDIYVRNP